MSFLSNLVSELDSIRNSGLGLLDHLYHPSSVIALVKPRSEKSTDSEVTSKKDVFEVNVDIQHFKPKEVNVKLADGYLVVEGKHEERKDRHGIISRQFRRRFNLPQDVNTETFSSKISSDGVLNIRASRKRSAVNEREIPIVQTGQPAIKRSKSDD